MEDLTVLAENDQITTTLTVSNKVGGKSVIIVQEISNAEGEKIGKATVIMPTECALTIAEHIISLEAQLEK